MPNTPNRERLQSDISSIARGAGIVFSGTVAGVGFKYLFELAVARSLGPGLFGIFFFGFSLFKIMERITTLGLNNGVLRFVSLYRGERDESRVKGTIVLGLGVTCAAGSILTVVFLFGSGQIFNHFFPESDLSVVLVIFALGIVFTGLTEILVFATQAFQIMEYKVLVRRILEPGTSLVLFVGFLLLGWKVLGAVSSFVLSIILGTVLAFFFAKKVIPYLTTQTPRAIFETRQILSFSWPLFFVGFFDVINIHINTVMLGHFQAAQDVGIYGAIWRTAFLAPIILESFNAIFAPIISDLYNRKELIRLRSLFKTVTKWVVTISLPVTILSIFFGREILSLWGQEYVMFHTSLIIICLAQFVNCSTGSVGFVIMMSGRSKINLANNALGFILTVILNLLLIPRFGILGAAVSMAVVIATINILRVAEVLVLLKIHPFRIDFFKPILAGGFSCVILFFSAGVIHERTHPIVAVAAGTLLFLAFYAGGLLVLGLGEEDKVIWAKIKERLWINTKHS